MSYFAVIRVAGPCWAEPPQNVMGQLGHFTPAMALRFYAGGMSRRDGEPECLNALVNGDELAAIGNEPPRATSNGPREQSEKPVNSGSKGP